MTDDTNAGGDEASPADRAAWAARLRDRRAEIADEERAAAERDRADLDGTLARILRTAKDLHAARTALPCYPATAAGRIADAVAAAERAGTCLDCRWRPDPDSEAVGDYCPREIEYTRFCEARRVLGTAGVPAGTAAPVLAAFARRRRIPGTPAIPLAPTDALRLVRAFRAGAAVADLSSGARVTFAGDEWALALGGAVGVGKSVAAAWWLLQGGRWARAADLARPDDELWSRLCGSARVVLDDVGEEYAGASGYATARVAELLAHRHAHGLATVLTTNLNRAEFAARYGARVDDRLRERGKWIGLVGESLRGRGR